MMVIRYLGVALLGMLANCISFESASAQGCQYRPSPAGLETRRGFVQFMEPERLAPMKAALPTVDNAQLSAILSSPNTMWYDDESIVFTYQDSEEVVTGARANCVGRDVGERNRNNSAIRKLLNYFGPDYRFKFPFRTVAGADDVANIKSVNFWSPPRFDGEAMPVKYWYRSPRQRWNWVFPVGTVFGEVLLQRSAAGEWYVFEIRTRTRYLDGWSVDLFRPYRTARELASAIKERRPRWQESTNLQTVVTHLEDDSNLVPHRLVSEAYGKVFEPVDGALDQIPAITDESLTVELLTEKTFVSTEGSIWKEGRGLETYGPGSTGEFSIVPAGYKMGLIPVNEVSCNRCHVETGHPLGNFEFDIILYGEIWGEDRIFTWHLFRNHARIWGTWDDADGSRQINSRLVEAGLVVNQQPAGNDPVYKPLPKPY